MSNKDAFDAAIARVNGLASKPPQDVQLELYGLYKQATAGDAGDKRPGALNMVARAKYDAWAAHRGTDKEAAMQAYIDLADELAGS